MIPRILLATAALCASSILANDQTDPGQGIAVVGTATVEVRPGIAELSFAIDATAEVAGDAINRFEQSRSRATQALEQLQIPNAEIIQQDFSIGVGNGATNSRVPVMVQRSSTRKTPSEVVLSQPITVRLTNIEKLKREDLIEQLTRIIDTARDLGLNLAAPSNSGQQSASVRFLLADPEKAQTAALDAAFADARSRAATLAKLAGVKVGPVLAVTAELPKSNAPAGTTPRTYYNAWGGVSVQQVANNSQSGSFSSIPVRASVQVRFAISP